MKIDAEWTDDCQGKKDFDGPVVCISTRYWPRGGGFHTFHLDSDGTLVSEGNEARPEIRAAATSEFLVNTRDDENLVLATRDFEGETEAQVKAEVERWADEQYARIVEVLKTAFGVRVRP